MIQPRRETQYRVGRHHRGFDYRAAEDSSQTTNTITACAFQPDSDIPPGRSGNSRPWASIRSIRRTEDDSDPLSGTAYIVKSTPRLPRGRRSTSPAMVKKIDVPDAWDDDWETQADQAAAEPTPAADPEALPTKAERQARHAETNRQLWESAYGGTPSILSAS